MSTNAPVCASSDPEIWFPKTVWEVVHAKQQCKKCPLELACLEVALVNNEEHGVWGGLTPEERGELRGEGAA